MAERKPVPLVEDDTDRVGHPSEFFEPAETRTICCGDAAAALELSMLNITM